MSSRIPTKLTWLILQYTILRPVWLNNSKKKILLVSALNLTASASISSSSVDCPSWWVSGTEDLPFSFSLCFLLRALLPSRSAARLNFAWSAALAEFWRPTWRRQNFYLSRETTKQDTFYMLYNTPTSDQDRISPYCLIQHQTDKWWELKKYQLKIGDYWWIQYQILHTNVMIVWSRDEWDPGDKRVNARKSDVPAHVYLTFM